MAESELQPCPECGHGNRLNGEIVHNPSCSLRRTNVKRGTCDHPALFTWYFTGYERVDACLFCTRDRLTRELAEAKEQASLCQERAEAWMRVFDVIHHPNLAITEHPDTGLGEVLHAICTLRRELTESQRLCASRNALNAELAGEVDRLREAASKWDALRNCARMTTLGSAGIHPLSDSFGDPEGHLTLNLWTHTGDGWGLGSEKDEQDASGRRDLDTFVRKALALVAPPIPELHFTDTQQGQR